MTNDANPRPGPDWSRRDFLRAASLGGVSTVTAAAMPTRSAVWPAHPAFGKARSCLLIFLAGGPSHLDTFDPKPDAPADVRGEFRPIATRVPGLLFSEHLPRLARRADRLTVIRSVGHADTSHATAAYRTLTGQPYPRDAGRAEHLSREDHPHLGSIASAAGGASRPGAIPFVTIPGPIGAPGLARAGQHAAALGPDFDPRLARWAPDGTDDDATSSGGAHEPDAVAAVARAVRREPSRVVDRYGRGRFGRSVLLGCRLVEAGARFVQVNWMPSVESGWDTHADGFSALKDVLLPTADRALSALLDDLAGGGALDQTLVVVMGEFGRSPRVTPGGGRGHWPEAYSILMAGAGIPGGRAFGATDRMGASPLDRPVAPESVAATILFALGIRPHEAAGMPQCAPQANRLDGPLLDLWC